MSEYQYRIVNGKRIPEQRAVIEELLHITLGEDQVVHHINGDKKDNRPENLQVMDRYQLFPNALARSAYVMLRRALAGDRPMLFTILALSSYDDLVPQLIRQYSQQIIDPSPA